MTARANARRWLGALTVAVASVVAVPAAVASPPPGADAGPKTMVALGDSFASAPLVPPQTEQPWGCMRSSNNYAHQVARELGLRLADATCSGARTRNMAGEQATFAGTNPPQLRALRADTDIVTVQIGGNDIGFADLARTCGEGELRGPGCAEAVAAKDPFGAIERTAPKLAAVLAEIHRRSPGAAIYVLGYPGIFRIGKDAGCPAMAASEKDAKYLRSIHEALNAMIERVAGGAANASYVDVYAPSKGHTACDPPVIRWVEPIVPVNAAYPAHPNLGGMTAIADILDDEIWPAGLPRRDTGPGLPL